MSMACLGGRLVQGLPSDVISEVGKNSQWDGIRLVLSDRPNLAAREKASEKVITLYQSLLELQSLCSDGCLQVEHKC